MRAIRGNPGLKVKGDPSPGAASSAGERESVSSRSSRRGESRARRRGQLERDGSDGLLASFVPPRGREDVDDEKRKAREDWIENQILREQKFFDSVFFFVLERNFFVLGIGES